jgi:NADH dehydrogenase
MGHSQNRIVVVGGGFGGLFTALNLAGAGEVTLISRCDHFLFTPLLYEYLSGEVKAWHIAPDYRELLDERVRFIRGEVTDIDLDRRTLIASHPDSGAPFDSIDYDVLALAVGGVTNFAGVPGAEAHSMEFRRLSDADTLRTRMIEILDSIPPDSAPQDARRAATFAVVGAGASGVELATKMADLLHDAFEQRGLKGDARVLILEVMDRVLPGMDDHLREFVERSLIESRVEVHTRSRVRAVTPRGLRWEHLEEEQEVDAAAVVWTAGVRVNPLVEKLPLEKDRRNLIVVEPTLQARGHADVFALGDAASYPSLHSPRLAGTAQLAFQEAKLAAKNIVALIEGKPLESGNFKEVGEALSLGLEHAALLAGGRVIDGALARRARFALYSLRLPTWQHRLRVMASWLFGGVSPRTLGPS